MKSASLFLLIMCHLALYSQEGPSSPRHFARERTYHVVHYKLNLEIDEKNKTCAGEMSVKLVPLRPQFDEVSLDAAGLNVNQVKLDYRKMDFRLSGESLLVTLDKPYGLEDTLIIAVDYSASSPRKGLYFIQPDSGYPRKQWQVWSQGEPEDNHYWFPCYDYPNDKATSEMIVTVRDKMTAISNGELIGMTRDQKHHTATYHWLERKPHPSYLISLVAGEYAKVEDEWDSIPIINYVYPHQKLDAMRSFGKTPQMLEFFSEKIGYRYPWEKYGHSVVDDFIYSGEENVSISTLTDRTIHDARAHLDFSSDALVAHELAHQWWGDMVTFRDWSHAWLSEGFASYFEILFQEHDRGRDAGMVLMSEAQRTVSNADVDGNRRPTVFDRYGNPGDVFDNRIYQKGACVLNMLHFILGDELFWKAIHHYVDKFAFQNVETNDLKIAIEEATGYNLQWFFDEWLYKAGYPDFEVQSRWDQSSRTVELTVKQIQRTDSLTGIFTMPVDIEIWIHDVPETHRVLISNKEETYSFPAYQQPQCILFDKGSALIKRVHFQKPLEEWIFQLGHARDAVDRLAAIDELQWMAESSAVIEALSKALLDDTFAGVRRDAVWTLGDVKQKDVSAQLVSAYGDSDAKVRAAAVTSLARYRNDNALKTIRHAFESDSSYTVAAAALRSLAKVDSSGRTGYCKEALTRDSYNEVIRSAALQVLSDLGDEDALKLIKSYSQYGIDRNLRIQSINALGSVWKSREDVVSYLIGLLNDPSFHVRRSVIDVLGSIGNPAAIPALEKSVEREADSRLVKAAREAIEKIRPVK